MIYLGRLVMHRDVPMYVNKVNDDILQLTGGGMQTIHIPKATAKYITDSKNKLLYLGDAVHMDSNLPLRGTITLNDRGTVCIKRDGKFTPLAIQKVFRKGSSISRRIYHSCLYPNQVDVDDNGKVLYSIDGYLPVYLVSDKRYSIFPGMILNGTKVVTKGYDAIDYFGIEREVHIGMDERSGYINRDYIWTPTGFIRKKSNWLKEIGNPYSEIKFKDNKLCYTVVDEHGIPKEYTNVEPEPEVVNSSKYNIGQIVKCKHRYWVITSIHQTHFVLKSGEFEITRHCSPEGTKDIEVLRYNNRDLMIGDKILFNPKQNVQEGIIKLVDNIPVIRTHSTFFYFSEVHAIYKVTERHPMINHKLLHSIESHWDDKNCIVTAFTKNKKKLFTIDQNDYGLPEVGQVLDIEGNYVVVTGYAKDKLSVARPGEDSYVLDPVTKYKVIGYFNADVEVVDGKLKFTDNNYYYNTPVGKDYANLKFDNDGVGISYTDNTYAYNKYTEKMLSTETIQKVPTEVYTDIGDGEKWYVITGYNKETKQYSIHDDGATYWLIPLKTK